MLAMLIAGVAIVLLIAIAAALENWKSWIFIILIPVVVGQCLTNPGYIEHEKQTAIEDAAAYKAKVTPRPVSSTPDGCTVYVFTTDRDHYFTRCGSRVTTDTNYSEKCGKSCTKELTDTIVTEGNK